MCLEKTARYLLGKITNRNTKNVWKLIQPPGLHGALGGLQRGDEAVEGDAVVLGEVGQHQAQRLQITDQLS